MFDRRGASRLFCAETASRCNIAILTTTRKKDFAPRKFARGTDESVRPQILRQFRAAIDNANTSGSSRQMNDDDAALG
jgi:hypothetical protein